MGALQIAAQLRFGIVRKTQISAAEILVDHRSAEKTRQLLFFDRVARNREDVSATGEDGAGNVATERRKESEIALFKEKFGIATAQFNATG